MWKDPIVEEIRAIREEIAQKCGNDIGRIVEYLRSKEKEHSGRLVTKEAEDDRNGCFRAGGRVSGPDYIMRHQPAAENRDHSQEIGYSHGALAFRTR